MRNSRVFLKIVGKVAKLKGWNLWTFWIICSSVASWLLTEILSNLDQPDLYWVNLDGGYVTLQQWGLLWHVIGKCIWDFPPYHSVEFCLISGQFFWLIFKSIFDHSYENYAVLESTFQFYYCCISSLWPPGGVANFVVIWSLFWIG